MITTSVKVPIDDLQVQSTIYTPQDSKVIVLVSHEPGCGRFNVRNKQFGEQLYHAGLATFLLDWNTISEIEEKNGGFSHIMRAKNLTRIIQWLKEHQTFKHFSAVLYGTSIGAASALIAASELGDSIQAVISRNGRLELAEPYLEKVKTPTLIAVGKKDQRLLESNKKAFAKLECPKKLIVLSGICPFFEKPIKVKKLGKMAIDWINKYSLRPKNSARELSPEFR